MYNVKQSKKVGKDEKPPGPALTLLYAVLAFFSMAELPVFHHEFMHV